MKNALLPILILLVACSSPASEADIAQWKEEIRQAEKDFNDMAASEGVAKAFATFAAEDGVIRRAGEIIKGREAIAEWYNTYFSSNATLTWEPSFIDVSQSGDLGYTYGGYTFTSTDSTGNERSSTGFFHSVWKRQGDGSWKFVWD